MRRFGLSQWVRFAGSRDSGPSRTAGAGRSVPDHGISRRRHSFYARVRHLHPGVAPRRSACDSYGCVALELPVVATTVGEIPDALDESSSILIEPGAVGALVAAHTEMAERVRLGTTSTGAGAERFDAKAAASTLAKRYQELDEP